MLLRSKNRYFSRAKSMLAACTLVLAAGAGSEAAELRERLSVEASVVTLSDIFTDTGANGDAIVMQAPNPGKRKQITSFDLGQLAQKYELEWQRPAYLKRVYIHREGTHFSSRDLHPVILDQLRELGMDAELDIKIYGMKKGYYLPLGYGIESIEFESFELTDRQDRFSSILKLPTSEQETTNVRISGTVQVVRLVPVLSRLITPGEVITNSDITWKRHPANRINLHAVVDANALIGQTVRRALPANKLLHKNDVTMPVVIAKGSAVNIVLRSGLMTLTLKGRALDDGGQGDVIRVMNTKSNRSLEARVVSPGKVEVDPRPVIKVASR